MHAKPRARRKTGQKIKEETLRIISSTFCGADKTADHTRAAVKLPFSTFQDASLDHVSLHHRSLFFNDRALVIQCPALKDHVNCGGITSY